MKDTIIQFFIQFLIGWVRFYLISSIAFIVLLLIRWTSVLFDPDMYELIFHLNPQYFYVWDLIYLPALIYFIYALGGE